MTDALIQEDNFEQTARPGASQEAAADDMASAAADAFTAALDPDVMIDNVLWGLSTLLNLVERPGMAEVSEGVASRLRGSIITLSSGFAERFTGKLRGDLRVTGLAGALGIAAVLGKTSEQVTASEPLDRLLDYLDHVALLKVEIEALCLRDRIEKRGAPLRAMLASLNATQHAPHQEATVH
ncbi:hypothetical protein [Rhodopseudomonas pseudopalustris]|uniref:Uncharacterized protein n=1 Tax=Rhodopseudomonas pseudopalustris TaxID=1513892 RepID=A0A1H8LS63_9BRAD|nr:hypothetical protein [Rhodopseudomonas pseudopalustris]SEO07919.1 hypothetical protein SAMN05444123_101198 [Rhodopseudomonas pseudopalustris]